MQMWKIEGKKENKVNDVLIPAMAITTYHKWPHDIFRMRRVGYTS